VALLIPRSLLAFAFSAFIAGKTSGFTLVANFAAAVVAAVIFQVINPPLQTTPIVTDEPPYQTPR